MTGRRDPERDLDDLLQDGGGELGQLYRRLPRYEPPRRLDRAILGEAARAVHSGRPPRRQRWIIGVGSAAGLVLAAGIAWRIGHDAMNGPPVSTETAPVAAPRVVPVQPISESARSHRDEPAPVTSPLDSAAPAPAAPPPAVTGAVSKRAAAEADKPRLKDRMMAAPKPAQTQAQEPPPPQATKSAAPTPFPADAKAEQAEEKAANAVGADREESAAGGGPMRQRTQQPTPATRLPESAPTSSVELRRDMQLAPEEWLAHIHQLVRQGRRQQAAESLRLFQRAHPDWEIPDDLRALQR